MSHLPKSHGEGRVQFPPAPASAVSEGSWPAPPLDRTPALLPPVQSWDWHGTLFLGLCGTCWFIGVPFQIPHSPTLLSYLRTNLSAFE